MNAADRALAQEVAALKAALATAETKGLQVAAELAVARAKASEDTALIAQQKLRIAKLERQVYGQRSERSARLIDQLSLTFEELEAGATEDELAAEAAVAKTTNVAGFTRKRPERNTFPNHLPRERVVIDPPTACECCGGARLRKLGEDVTRTLETQPRQWKVIETIREKFTCRDCEKISQAPAPFHAVARGWAGPSLLAMSRQMRSICPDRVREVWSASAVEPSGRALRSGRRADRSVDHGGRRRVGLRGARSPPTPLGSLCYGGRALAWG
jgi:transposase